MDDKKNNANAHTAGNDLNSINSVGTAHNNLINSIQHIHYSTKEKEENQELIRLKLKNFLDGNIQVANSLIKLMAMPMVERFDIFKAQQLEEEVLIVFPSIYNTFHELRLMLEKANRIIESATEVYNRPDNPMLPNNGKVPLIHHLFRDLRQIINGKILTLSMNILGNENIICEDSLHI